MPSAWCATCGRTGIAFLCGGCRGVQYCSRECQTKDWVPYHRHVCRDPATRPLLRRVLEASQGQLMVRLVPGRGRGLVTTCAVAMGTELLVDPQATVLWGPNDPLGLAALPDVDPDVLCLHPAPLDVTVEDDLMGLKLCQETMQVVQHVLNRVPGKGHLSALKPPVALDSREGAPGLSMEHVHMLVSTADNGGDTHKCLLAFTLRLADATGATMPEAERAAREWVMRAVVPMARVVKANSYQLAVHGKAKLFVLSVPASLINHSCHGCNSVVYSRGALVRRPPSGGSDAGTGTAADLDDVGLYSRTVQFVARATRAIGRHEEVLTSYNLHRAEGGGTEHRDLLREEFGVECEGGPAEAALPSPAFMALLADDDPGKTMELARGMVASLGGEPVRARNRFLALFVRLGHALLSAKAK